MALSKNSKILASDVTGAIKSITRSGTTFTYTTLGGSTGTFTQQDNNTTYSAGTGISISSNKITNTGVTSVNGQTGAVTVSATSYPQVQKSTVSNKRVYAPSGGTWFCFGRWGYETDNDSYTNFASVNGVSGGGVIVSQTGNSYYSHWSEIYCIRTA